MDLEVFLLCRGKVMVAGRDGSLSLIINILKYVSEHYLCFSVKYYVCEAIYKVCYKEKRWALYMLAKVLFNLVLKF